MKLCIDLYLKRDRHYDILDFGSRSRRATTPTHRDLFDGYDVSITGVDVLAGHNVDIVMTRPYRIPMKSNSVDVVVTGQVFEHIPFPWVSFLELCRVLKPGGYIFLTAPSRGHVHNTMDSWRYYPDSMRSLAAFSRMRLEEAYTDFPPAQDGSALHDLAEITRVHYWGDTVGVFRKPQRYSRAVPVVRAVLTWWANRVGGIEHVPMPELRKRRSELTRGL